MSPRCRCTACCTFLVFFFLSPMDRCEISLDLLLASSHRRAFSEQRSEHFTNQGWLIGIDVASCWCTSSLGCALSVVLCGFRPPNPTPRFLFTEYNIYGWYRYIGNRGGAYRSPNNRRPAQNSSFVDVVFLLSLNSIVLLVLPRAFFLLLVSFIAPPPLLCARLFISALCKWSFRQQKVIEISRRDPGG